MINVAFSTLGRILTLPQKTIALILGNIKLFSILLVTGLTLEEAIYGLRLIRYLGLI